MVLSRLLLKVEGVSACIATQIIHFRPSQPGQLLAPNAVGAQRSFYLGLHLVQCQINGAVLAITRLGSRETPHQQQ